jgi:hypothetical protein
MRSGACCPIGRNAASDTTEVPNEVHLSLWTSFFVLGLRDA